VRTGIRLIDEDFASPTVANGVVYVGSENATLYAFNALSGALLWDAAALPIQSSPTVVNGMVYLMHALRDADPYRDRQAERTPTRTATSTSSPSRTPTRTPSRTPTARPTQLEAS
jgi:outer membrane protein assembly factor BamB